ncbi:hypothetical protein HMPREF1162_2001 [ [[Propionibacterium] namnetense SK182B-JCVI]|uniref:Uncharacterized protein n=1 Tax=[Propionibacterium] namnetense SK182B-JCVI TaxID=1051006 RepID=F9NX24_9ACTN|nr:hypothetical protein HMPREF1162_2001 [ [[Propionibacterium] namnetense SK182B-JCVI]
MYRHAKARTNIRTNRTCFNRVSPCTAGVKLSSATTQRGRVIP